MEGQFWEYESKSFLNWEDYIRNKGILDFAKTSGIYTEDNYTVVDIQREELHTAVTLQNKETKTKIKLCI